MRCDTRRHHQLAGRQRQILPHQRDEPAFAKIFVAGIHRFGDAVRVNQQHVAGAERDRFFLKREAGQDAENEAAGCQARGRGAG